MKGIIDLADVQESPAVVTVFYDRLRGKIMDIETVEQKNNILSDMQQSDEYWEAVVDESGQIAKKYDNAKLEIVLILAAIEELERKNKEIRKMP